MPHVTTPLTGGACCIQVHIGPGKRLREACARSRIAVPPTVACTALIDTGAAATCVDPDILSKAASVPKNRRPVLTPSTGNTPHMANVYDVAIYLVHPGHKGFADSEYVLSNEIEAIESILKPIGVEVLLGMNVLRRCLFVLDGPHERFTLAI